MKYAIVTFGCRVNQADSISIERQLRSFGGYPVPTDEAELVVINTCSVTATADHGARQIIRRIARTNPSARIVATGCYATRASQDLAKLPKVTDVIANSNKDKMVAQLLLDQSLTTSERFGDGDGACGQTIRPGTAGRTSALLRVQTGCDEACAYCIIPSTRGSGRSMPVASVLAEVDRMADEGFKEAAITGVHLGSYGRDLSPPSSLLELLRSLEHHPSNLLFRMSSLEPMDCIPEIVNLVACSERFAPHFHLPLQNASNRMLQAMRRPYTSGYYQRLVDSIREKLPHAAIGSDFIVGFPGETDVDFETNMSFLRDSPITYLHVFPYSDRPGTAATQLPVKVPGATIRDRGRAIRAIGTQLAARFCKAQIGTVRQALTIDGGNVAVTDNYLKVRIVSSLKENERVNVKILASKETLIGEVIG